MSEEIYKRNRSRKEDDHFCQTVAKLISDAQDAFFSEETGVNVENSFQALSVALFEYARMWNKHSNGAGHEIFNLILKNVQEQTKWKHVDPRDAKQVGPVGVVKND